MLPPRDSLEFCNADLIVQDWWLKVNLDCKRLAPRSEDSHIFSSSDVATTTTVVIPQEQVLYFEKNKGSVVDNFKTFSTTIFKAKEPVVARCRDLSSIR